MLSFDRYFHDSVFQSQNNYAEEWWYNLLFFAKKQFIWFSLFDLGLNHTSYRVFPITQIFT